MKPFLLSVLMFFCIGWVHAESDIYVCVDSNGLKTFSNVGKNKGCKKADLPGLMTFPATDVKRAGRASTTKAPANFPSVDNATQKNRDTERRQILETELKTEQKKLNELNAEYKNGVPDRLGNESNYAKYLTRTEMLKQDINRSQQNIEALQREINGLK